MRIFLDIDGVMVPAKGWKSPELLKDGFPSFSSKATYVLQNLIEDDTVIMLTTSHKANFSIEEWICMFKNRNINIDHVMCLPANVGNLSRKDEIVNWFNVNHISDHFIIIDDDRSLNELPSFLKDHLVQTSPYIGLTEEHLEMARAIIGRSKSLIA
jgi:hypothetical protein